MAAAELKIEGEGDRLTLRAAGRWTGEGAARLDRRLHTLDPRNYRRVRFELGAVEALDTVGAWLLNRTRDQLRGRGLEVELANVPTTLAPLIARVRETGAPPMPVTRHPSRILHFLARIGSGTIGALRFGYDLLGFYGLVTVRMSRVVMQPWRLRLNATVRHLEETGLDALPIVGLISLLVGLVLAYQGAASFDLRGRGGELGRRRHFARDGHPLDLHRRGRSLRQCLTAEIGTMKVNEEVDALSTLGLDPIEILVLPRLIALLITLPLLTFFGDIMSLVGGAIGGLLLIDLTLPQFLDQLSIAVTPIMFWVGIVKAPVFAFVISMVGCFEGLRVTGSAESVGRQTTKSVVESIFLVIVLDALFSILFSVLRI